MADESAIEGSVRYFDPKVRELAELRICTLANRIASVLGAEAAIDHRVS